MANHKSSVKRARQSLKKNARNSATKKSIRTIEKKLRGLISKKAAAEAKTALVEFIRRIDKAAQKGIVHRTNASRRISRLSQHVDSI